MCLEHIATLLAHKFLVSIHFARRPMVCHHQHSPRRLGLGRLSSCVARVASLVGKGMARGRRGQKGCRARRVTMELTRDKVLCS